MTRPPPISPLFPYTTLFRSFYVLVGIPLARLVDIYPRKYVLAGGITLTGGITDRKSTRLNSSHRCISYAVFCLKKKNKQLDLLSIHLSYECGLTVGYLP